MSNRKNKRRHYGLYEVLARVAGIKVHARGDRSARWRHAVQHWVKVLRARQETADGAGKVAS